MQKSNPLLRTKICVPFVRPSLVGRPRLQNQIVQGLRGPLTVVIAPAGFGKTTLVASSVADFGLPVAWLSLDPSDNQAGRFLAYLIAALQGADRRIGMDAAQLVAGIEHASPEAVLTSLINDLESVAKGIILVLDDYQFISSRTVHEQVAFLLEHCPRAFHLLIATRSDPPLPLARLRARGQMLELRTADLRFTPDEAAQFLNEMMSLDLDAESVVMLEQRTEGWIAGLQMAALSVRNRGDVRGFIEGFSGTNRYILDYLLEEILNQQSLEIQRFLLYTSVLERFNAPLCDALFNDEVQHPAATSNHQSASILEYLDRENLFLVSLDDERLWFRYHHLFADLLKARLQQSQPNVVRLLHTRASVWLEQRGFVPEAIQHIFAANEIEHAADLIERYGPLRWAESDPSIVQLADNLPLEILVARPKIGFYYAWYLVIQGLVEKALPLLNDMARQLANADTKSEQKWIETMIALALSFLGKKTSAPGFDPFPDARILDEIPADEPILRDVAEILYGMTLGRRGEIDRAAVAALKFIQRTKPSHQTLTIPTMIPFLARIYLIQGQLRAAASLCREYLEPIQEKGARFVFSAGSLNIILGEVLYERNCLEEAEEQIREGLRANKPWSDIMTDAWGLSALARVLQAKGDSVGAMQNVDQFETRLQGHMRPREFEGDFHTLRVRVQMASGDLQSAIQWADQIGQTEDFHRHKDRYRLTLARIHLVQRRYADVEEILNAMRVENVSGNRITSQIELNLLLGAAAAERHHLSAARRLIESCLDVAEEEGYIQIFLDVGEPARQLLNAHLRLANANHKPYAEKLLNAFSRSSQTFTLGLLQAGLIEPLSGRELEVLQLIAKGKTNQEIAQQLIIARGTVKAHTASIYRKLDASNRTEAVARSRHLGILP